MYLRLHLLLHYFKCQKPCMCLYVKPRGNIAIEPETTALLAHASNERGLFSLSKGHSVLGDRSPFDNLQTNQNTIACHQRN